MTEQSPRTVLAAARALISDPSKWTQGYYAYDKNAKETDECGPEAVCWCSSGAIVRSAGGFGPLADGAKNVLSQVVGFVPRWNDEAIRTHAEVLAAFDAAIAKAVDQ